MGLDKGEDMLLSTSELKIIAEAARKYPKGYGYTWLRNRKIVSSNDFLDANLTELKTYG